MRDQLMAYRPAKTRKHCYKDRHMQHTSLMCANEEAFGKHSLSLTTVFRDCFPIVSSFSHLLKAQNLRLESKNNAFYIFSKQFLLTECNFVHATMFIRLRQPYGIFECDARQ